MMMVRDMVQVKLLEGKQFDVLVLGMMNVICHISSISSRLSHFLCHVVSVLVPYLK